MKRIHATGLYRLAFWGLILVCPSLTQANSAPLMAGVAGPAINLIYAYVTQDAGLWRKHDLDTKVVLFESGSTLAQVARTGEIKFAINSGPTTIAARTQGADAVIVAAAVNRLPYSLVAVKSITKWSDLKGKKIGISRFGSGTDTAIRMVCKKFGLDPTKDIIILQGGTQPSRLQALSAGSLDATLVSPPLDLTAKKQGHNVLANIAELGIAYPQLVIESTDRFNRENPKIVKSFLKGFIEGIHYVAANKEETKRIITKYLKTSDPEILEATYQSFLQVTDYNANPNLDGIRNAIDEVALRVPAAKNRKPEDFIDLRFLRELDKEGFFKQLQKKI
ncbi:MAG TPA: ABC transporter substrate-binding protein [Candidatus Binatia bacterium]|nr:ABC transporter substrate-binding protein [Candidatus Binatia bacterium]